MMAYFKHRIDRIAVRSALGCFLLGSVLFLTLLTGQLNIIENVGVAFLVLAIAVNSILIGVVGITCLIHPKELGQHVMAMVLSSVNYPLAALYIYFLF